MKKIAIQGTLGSYHDIAAHKYFEGEEIELICCSTFEDVFQSIRKDSQVIGMLAIENTIAGSLLHNNELLRSSGTQIIGEYKLLISHSFVCLPEEDWDGSHLPPHRLEAMSRIPATTSADKGSRRRRHGTKCRNHPDREPERSCRHLFAGCRRTLWDESVAGRHRDKQTQLHPFPGSGRSVASR